MERPSRPEVQGAADKCTEVKSVRARLNVEADPKLGPRRPRGPKYVVKKGKTPGSHGPTRPARCSTASKIIRKTEDEEGAETVVPEPIQETRLGSRQSS